MTAPTMPAAPTLDTLGKARDAALADMSRARGKLIEALLEERDALPPSVRARLAAYLVTSARVTDIKTDFRGALIRSREQTGDPVASERQARISALIAYYVMNYRLARVDGQRIFHWRTIDEKTGRLKDVPNYAGDSSATDKALAIVAERQFSALSRALMERATVGPASSPTLLAGAIATASPLAKALAILDTIGIPETDDPPTVAD